MYTITNISFPPLSVPVSSSHRLINVSVYQTQISCVLVKKFARCSFFLFDFFPARSIMMILLLVCLFFKVHKLHNNPHLGKKNLKISSPPALTCLKSCISTCLFVYSDWKGIPSSRVPTAFWNWGFIWSYFWCLYLQCIAAYRGPHHFWWYKPNFGGKNPLQRANGNAAIICHISETNHGPRI